MLRSFKSFVSCLAASCLFFAGSPAIAAPVTYRFQATVGELPPFNGDVGLPFTLVEGSVIDGLLTIDPALNVPPPGPFGSVSEATQPHSIRFSYEGFTFGTYQYRSRVFNDNEISDGPNAGPADLIELRCSANTVQCSPQPIQFPGSLPLTLSTTMNFAGNVGLLPSPILPTDIDIWNGFAIEREIRITFASGATGELFDSTITAFTLVPEPCSIYLLILPYGSAFLSRSSRQVT